jgi:DNA-binding NtrC family response regulator
MPQMNGMELLKKINQTWPCREVVMLTAEGSVEEAVDAMKQGASPVLSSRRILMR